MRTLALLCLLCVILNAPHAPSQEKFLRPPDFKAPKGSHYQSTGVMPDELYKPCLKILQAAADPWEKLYDTHKLAEPEYVTMERLLRDERIVGDGIHVDAGYRPTGMAAGWALSLRGIPSRGPEYSANLRIYPKGKGISAATLKKEFGRPRSEQQVGKTKLITYGNVSAVFGEKDEYIGAVFFYKPPQK